MMVLLRLPFFWFSQYNIFQWQERGTMSLDDSDKPVEQYECLLIISKFVSASLSGFLLPPLKVSPVAGYSTCKITTRLYNSWHSFFLFDFETANQSGFEPGSLVPKAARLTIELHSIDK